MKKVNDNEDYEIWHFPPFDEVETEPPEEGSAYEVIKEALEKKEDTELAQIKEDLQKKLHLFDEIHAQMNLLLSEINVELTQKIMQLIQKITFKLIQKEIKMNTKTLLNMLDTTLKQIEEYQLCEILLSEKDYNQLTEEERSGLKVPIKINPDFSSGDFKIKTETGEITAVLEDRIRTFLGL